MLVEDYDEDHAVFVDEDDQDVFVDDDDEAVFIDDDEDLGEDAEFGEEKKGIDCESMWITETSINTSPKEGNITAQEFEESQARNDYNKYVSICK